MRRLKIAHKLGLASLLFLVPVAYMVWALVAQQNISIDFGRKEADGTLYLRGLAGAHMGLARNAATGAAFDARAAGQTVGAFEQERGAGMESTELSGAAADALAKLAAGASPATADGARDALRALIARVGDKSNLILDPDLDSYYVMDLVLIKLPDLVDRAAAMSLLSRKVWADGSIGTDEQVDFYVALGGLTSLLEGVDASVAAGYSGNADGSLKANLDPAYLGAKQALAAFVETVGKGAVDEAQAAKTLDAVGTFYTTASSELERLLDKRVDGFIGGQRLTLAITAALFLAAIGAVLTMISLAVIRRLRRLTGDMTALAGGDLDRELAVDSWVDEVTDMARTVQVFRDNMIKARTLEAQQAAEHAAREARVQKIESLTRSFEAASAPSSTACPRRRTRCRRRRQSMTATAEETSRQSTAVAAASEQASTNVQTVASAAEELSSSVAEISRQVSSSSTIAGKAVQRGRAHQRAGQGAGRRGAEDRRRDQRSSTRSPARPTCWRSTPRSRRRAPARPARASPSWPPR